MRPTERHARASALLASLRDVIDARPSGSAPPPWCDARGWRPFLDGLPDDLVDRAERDGLAALLPARSDAPRDLVALARDLAEVTALPSPAAALALVDGRRASPRKRLQVAAFAARCADLARGCDRVVDVGSGHGHLTRHLARSLDLDAEGWERDPARVDVARALTHDRRARFVACDAAALTASLRAGDLVTGLHACGALGDLAVRAAGEAGAAVALVGCCLQKRDAAREPMAPVASLPDGALTLGRAVLGVGNERDGDEGVEADLATRIRSRVQREALRSLLVDAGCALAPGEEMRGVNRRRATHAFDDLVAWTFSRRALPPPDDGARAEALRAAQVAYERSRRWSLARGMTARLVEVWVALDRAEHLRRRGHDVTVLAAFDASVSPRNVMLLASPR